MTISATPRDAVPVPVSTRGQRRHRETNVDVYPRKLHGRGGRPGQIHEMVHSHPLIRTAWDEVEDEFGDVDWQLKPCGTRRNPERPREQEARELLEEFLEEGGIVTDVENARDGGMNALMRARASVLLHNFDCANIRWTDQLMTVPLSSGMHLPKLELFTIDQATVDDWDGDRETGKVHGLWQSTIDWSTRYIPRERLYWTVMRGAGAEGAPPAVRSLFAFFLTDASVLHAYAQAVDKAAGYLEVKETQADHQLDDENIAIVNDLFDESEWTARKRFFFPFGTDGGLKFPQGTLFDPTVFSKYFAHLVNQVFGRYLQSLGWVSGNSSQALGREQQRDMLRRKRRTMNTVGALVAGELFPWILRSIGYGDCRPPGLEANIDTEAMQPAEAAQVATQLITSRIWAPTPELAEHFAREIIPLPESVVASFRAEFGRRRALERVAATAGGTAQPPVAPGVQALGARIAEGTPAPGQAAMADTPLITVFDANGESFQFYQSLSPEEELVTWASNDRERDFLDQELAGEIADTQREHRQRLWDVLSTRTPEQRIPALQDLLTEYTERYADAIERYVLAVESAAERQGVEERERELQRGVATVAAPETTHVAQVLQQWGVRQVEQMRLEVHSAASTIASKVQNTTVNAHASGASQATLPPLPNVHMDAAAPANRAEAVGRIIEAALNEEPGFQLVEVYRSSVRDRNRCDVCAERHGLRWSVRTEDEQRLFLADPRALTPDPQCHSMRGGVLRCRCGYLARHARVSNRLGLADNRPRIVRPKSLMLLSQMLRQGSRRW